MHLKAFLYNCIQQQTTGSTGHAMHYHTSMLTHRDINTSHAGQYLQLWQVSQFLSSTENQLCALWLQKLEKKGGVKKKVINKLHIFFLWASQVSSQSLHITTQRPGTTTGLSLPVYYLVQTLAFLWIPQKLFQSTMSCYQLTLAYSNRSLIQDEPSNGLHRVGVKDISKHSSRFHI